MTDAPFVIAAFAVVLASLGAYSATLGRRISAARGAAEAVEHERDRRGLALETPADRDADDAGAEA